MHIKGNLKLSFSIFAIAILYILGKFSSMGRESFIASSFGLSSFSDAYVLVMNIPFRLSILISTLIYFTFIPSFSKYLIQKEERAMFLASFSFWLIGSVILLVVFIFLSAPFLVKILAPGIDKGSQLLAGQLIRSSLPIIIFYALAALLAGINACFGNYATTYLSKSLDLIVIFFFVLIFLPVGGIYVIPYALIIGSIAALISQKKAFSEIRRTRVSINSEVLFYPQTFSVFKSLLPLVLAALFLELNTIVIFHIASKLFIGCIAVLNFAYAIVQFVFGLIEAWTISAIMPLLSQDLENNKMAGFYQKSVRYTRMVLFVSISFLLFIFLFSTDIVKILFQRGKFDFLATQITTKALIGFGIGLIPLALDSLFFKVVYLLKSFREIVYLVGIRVGINIALSFILSYFFGFFGLTLAFSLSLIANLILTLWFLKKRTGFMFFEYRLSDFFTLTLGIAVTVVYVIICKQFIPSFCIARFLYILSGVIIYLVILSLLRSRELSLIKEQLMPSLGFYFSRLFKRSS